MSVEEWRTVPFAPGYEVSDQGRVRSWLAGAQAPRVLVAPVNSRWPYRYVPLSVDGQRKQYAVHRIVGEAFLGPQPEGLVTRHLNGNSLDNRAINIAYGTRSENEYDKVRHGTHQQARVTHCPARHPYDDENTRLYQGRRYCKACADARRYARQAARAAS